MSLFREGFYLADVGNTHCHLYNGEEVKHLLHEEVYRDYAHHSIWYISVSHTWLQRAKSMPLWRNIAPEISLNGAYEGMGIDRQALCLSRERGFFIDAGSAITLDYVKEGVYGGGVILPGVRQLLKSYAQISPALKTTLLKDVSLLELPKTTKEQISYGIIASIKALVQRESKGEKLYFTGGDGAWLCSYFEGAIYDETLLFQGILKTLKDKKLC